MKKNENRQLIVSPPSKRNREATELFNKYLHTYAGASLLNKYNLDEYGVWRIEGEDENCDLGGSHIRPDLGIVEGILEDVIRYGVALPHFWAWGGGGHFEKMKPSEYIPKKIFPQDEKNRWYSIDI